MSIRRFLPFAGLAAVVLLLGVTMVVPALAQDEEPTGRLCVGFGLFGGHGWAAFDAAAEALGLTPEELFAELRADKTLADIAEEQGVDLQSVYDAINASRVEAMKEAIQQAVEDEKISQEKADWLLEGLENGYWGGRGFFGFGHRFGGHGFLHGMGIMRIMPGGNGSASAFLTA